MKTTAAQIVIMQCAINGDKIESRSMCSEYWSPWIGHPIWDWLHNDYRVGVIKSKGVTNGSNV